MGGGTDGISWRLLANHHSVSASFSERTFLEIDGGDRGGNSVGKALAVQVWRPVFRQMPRTQREVPEVCICTASATEEMGTRQENP